MMERFPNSAGVVVNDHDTSVLIEIDPLIYPEDVALKAAYWLTDRFYVHITRSEAGRLVAEIRAQNGQDGPALLEACGEFCNSLIDFAVRARVATETQDIQEALLQRAFIELTPKMSN